MKNLQAMVGRSAQILRVSMVLLLLRLDLLACQQSAGHGKVPLGSEPQLDSSAGEASVLGSWGPWGPWSACSRSCGGGVQEQARTCLPAYATQAPYPSRAAPPSSRPLPPGHVVSALRPSVPLHRDTGQPQHSNTTRQGELVGPKGYPHPGRRGAADKRITPGMYGYGKMPYIVPLRTDAGLQRGGFKPRGRRQTPPGSPQSPAQRRSHWNLYRHQSPRPVYDSLRHQHREMQLRSSPAKAFLYQPGPVQTSQWDQRTDSQPASAQPISCRGSQKNYKRCNAHSCPPASRHIREVQCSFYDSVPFMGRLYEWEPFNEAQSNQHCQLNCRAVGFRFYVQQSEKVIDGTPCGVNETSICVAGKCQP